MGARPAVVTCISPARATWRDIPASRHGSARSRRAARGHGWGHFAVLAEVGDAVIGGAVGATQDNLASAFAGETYDDTEMCAGVATTAGDDGFAEIVGRLGSIGR